MTFATVKFLVAAALFAVACLAVVALLFPLLLVVAVYEWLRVEGAVRRGI